MNKYTYQGKEYSSRELAEIGGVSITLFTKRVEQNGWSVEDAVKGENTNVSAGKAKKQPKKRRLTAFASCSARCNAK